MRRGLLPFVAIIGVLLTGCGDGEQEPPPATRPPPAATAPQGSLSGTLVWHQAPYLHTGDLDPGAVDAAGAERLGEAEVGPERVPLEVFSRGGEAPWQLLSQGAEGWLVWEPLALLEARRHLADRLGVAPDDVLVRSLEEVDWPDSCLGAGEAGEVCAAVITPGFRIDLEAGGVDYGYRTDRGGRVRPEP